MSGDSNIVYIGQKPTMNYVLAIITSINSSNKKEVTLKARGQAISRAVDVAEIVRRRFIKDLEVKDIKTGTEQIQQEEGGTRSVSTIDIKLSSK
jgi:DNA-binding protein